jgi:putative transposase
MAKNDDAVEKFLEGIDFKNLSTEEISGPNGLLKLLTKRVIEKAMNAEMTEHLGYEKNRDCKKICVNSHNYSHYMRRGKWLWTMKNSSKNC